MTKFMTLNNAAPKRVIRKTVFTEIITIKGEPYSCEITDPEDWDNVLFLGNDPDYGDVFKAWDNDTNCFTLYFGKKGDEFND